MKEIMSGFIDFKELGYFVKNIYEYAHRIDKLLEKWKKEDEERVPK